MVPGVSSSSLGPATPRLTRREWGQPGRGAEVVASTVTVGPHEQPQEHLSASGTGHAGLFVIQSQSMSSSALAVATGSGTAQQGFTERSGASGALAASGVARSWSHTNHNSSGSSGGSGNLNSSSSGALAISSSSSRRGPRVEPVSLYGPLPLLADQQVAAGSLQPQQAPAAALLLQATAASGALSPGRGNATASATAAAAASSPAGSAASCGTATAAPAVAARNHGSQSEAGAASSVAHSGSPPGQAVLAPGALSPDTGSTASWAPQRLMPLWGPRVAGPGQGPSSWSLSGTTTGAANHSTQGMGATLASTRTDEQPTQDQQQPQLSQQLTQQLSGQQQQQEFVPMVPYRVGQQQQPSLDGQVQQQYGQYVPLIQMQEEQGQQPQQPHGQKRLSDCSSNTTRSQPQLSGQQLQQRQHPRAVQRFDPGSGGSSYFGSKAQSGEAQTWLILEFCDGGTLLDLMQEGLLFSTATGLLNMVGAWNATLSTNWVCRCINLCVVACVACVFLDSVRQAK